MVLIGVYDDIDYYYYYKETISYTRQKAGIRHGKLRKHTRFGQEKKKWEINQEGGGVIEEKSICFLMLAFILNRIELSAYLSLLKLTGKGTAKFMHCNATTFSTVSLLVFLLINEHYTFFPPRGYWAESWTVRNFHSWKNYSSFEIGMSCNSRW